MSKVTTKILENGLTVIIEHIPHAKTTTVAAGVRTGSRDETEKQGGIAHFLEHMLFKGTKTRNYVELSKIIEDVGGYMNAYTSKSTTVYYARVLNEHMERAADFVSDIVFNSELPEDEFLKEKGVIIEEINRSLDNPARVNYSNFLGAAFSGALGKDTLGTKDQINGYKVDNLREFYDCYYVPKNMIVSISGGTDTETALSIVEKYFQTDKTNDNLLDTPKETFSHVNSIHTKQGLNQISSILAFELKGYDDISLKEELTIDIMNTILSDGFTSKLFDEIREKRGLVYSISAGSWLFADTGMFIINAGTSSEKLKEYIKAVAGVLKSLPNTITQEEFENAKVRFKASLMFAKDKIADKAASNFETYHSYGYVIDDEEVLDILENITYDDVIQCSKSLFSQKVSSSILAPNLDVLDDITFVTQQFEI